MQGILLKISILKDYQKTFKKLSLFYLSNPVFFNDKLMKNKRGMELVTSRSSGYKTSLEKFLYYLTKIDDLTKGGF